MRFMQAMRTRLNPGVVFLHASYYAAVARRPPREVLAQLTSSADGLSFDEAERRLAHFGPNAVAGRASSPWWLRALLEPFQAKGEGASLSESAAVTVARVAGAVQDVGGGIIPIVRRKAVPRSDLVPGDIVFVAAGEEIPADLRVLASESFCVDEEALGGGRLPVRKSADAEEALSEATLGHRNLCFRGSRVVSGSATAVVLKTGADTFVASLARKAPRWRAGYEKLGSRLHR